MFKLANSYGCSMVSSLFAVSINWLLNDAPLGRLSEAGDRLDSDDLKDYNFDCHHCLPKFPCGLRRRLASESLLNKGL